MSKKRLLTLSNAAVGLLLQMEGSGYSEYTVRNYRLVFTRLVDYLGADTPIATIGADDITQFMAHLATLRQAPAGIASRPSRRFSNKTLRNHHTAVSALWTWAVEQGYADDHIVRRVKPPRPTKPTIVPFTTDDIHAMLSATARNRKYVQVHSKTLAANKRPTALRDKAILLLLLDTGLRAQELCDVTTDNLDLTNRTIRVWGKGAKERVVPFDAKVGRAIWEYQTQERPSVRDKHVFLNNKGHPMDPNILYKLIHRIGDRAGVSRAYPHRFRHTFAIMYLRNNGDIFTLKRVLGHETFEMVNRYLEIARADIEIAHATASPVAHL
jgi:site-specific recombinase XerD